MPALRVIFTISSAWLLYVRYRIRQASLVQWMEERVEIRSVVFDSGLVQYMIQYSMFHSQLVLPRTVGQLSSASVDAILPFRIRKTGDLRVISV
jgi:hypothetical protein